MSKKENTVEETVQHPAEYEQWIAQYKKIYTVECADDNGVVQRMYVRSPDYNLKAACVLTLIKNPESIAKVGEMILDSGFLGGFDMRQDDDMKLSAVFQLAGVVEVKDSVLKKNWHNTGLY